MDDRIALDIVDGVAHVRMVRGEKMNALDNRMFEALRETGRELGENRSVRAVVLSGEGRAFCAGLDMANFAGMLDPDRDAGVTGSGKLADRTHGIANGPQAAAWVWRELPQPVIAAVHGVAFGGGFQVCLGADLRYAAPDTRFSIMEIKWGLVPDMAGTQLMKTLARDDVIRELTYTGRVFSAQEALEYGFVTRIAEDPLALALETAAEIASKNPEAQRANKRLFNAAPRLSPAEGLLMESEEQDEIIGRPNQVEAVMAELEKRRANFTD
jgi:enoyl-CoA hydratase/carnithine racemase